jgi:hypothetical protein
MPAKKTAASKTGGAKAAATVAAGGGPEDPVTDVLALKALTSAKKAPKAAGQGTADVVRGRGSKLLLAEFLVCFVILGAGTVIAPTGSKDGVPRLMTRGTGLCILFFILALAAGGGDKARKSSEALGGLVTVSYLVLSSDAVNIFKWMTSFFASPAQAGTAVGDIGGSVAASQQAAAGVGNVAGAVSSASGE